MTPDRSRASIQAAGWVFVPLRPEPDAGVPLASSGLGKSIELIVFERGGQRRALVVREMAYHHIAQSTLAGEPYAISF